MGSLTGMYDGWESKLWGCVDQWRHCLVDLLYVYLRIWPDTHVASLTSMYDGWECKLWGCVDQWRHCLVDLLYVYLHIWPDTFGESYRHVWWLRVQAVRVRRPVAPLSDRPDPEMTQYPAYRKQDTFSFEPRRQQISLQIKLCTGQLPTSKHEAVIMKKIWYFCGHYGFKKLWIYKQVGRLRFVFLLLVPYVISILWLKAVLQGLQAGSIIICTNPDPDPSINKQQARKTLISTVFVISLWLVIGVADSGCLSRIPDPTFFHPGSRVRIVSNPDPRSRIRIKEFKYFNPKKWFLSPRKYDPGCSSRIRMLTFYPSRIPDPGVKKAPDPGSGSAPLHVIFEDCCEGTYRK